MNQTPSKLIQIILPHLIIGSHFFDLGCGRGREAIFMAEKGFKVTAVDSSAEAITRIKEIAEKNNLNNIEAICADVNDFVIEADKYEVIYSANLLQFLPKEKALAIIDDIKRKIKKDGYVVIAAFTPADPSYNLPEEKRFKAYFNPDELKKIFSDFKIIHYFEGVIPDKGHPGKSEPHEHGVARIIAQK
ncbi:MAG: methyltransferase domain-containing protein [Patescibacteria group bacterium]